MKKTKVLRKCLNCGKEFYKNLCRLKIGKGKYCSRKCYFETPKSKETLLKMSIVRRGINGPNWRGGLRDKTLERIDNYKWRILRKQIYMRDNYTCQICKKHCYDDIQCHHIVPFRIAKKFTYIFWNISVDSPGNLITLCASCHSKVEHAYRRKEEIGIYEIPAILYTNTTI